LYLRLAELTYSLYFGDPGRPEALLREVEDLAARMTRQWPKSPDGYRLQAQVLIARHRMAEAIALMEEAAGRLEPNPPLLTQMASAHYQIRDRVRSQEILRQLIAGHPHYGPAYDLLYLQLMEQRDLPAAREILDQKFAQHGGVPAGLQLAAHDLAQLDRQSADQVVAQIEQRYAADDLTFAQVGDFWLQRGEFEPARRCFEAGRQRFARKRSLYAGRLTEVLVAERRPGQARALVESELRNAPNDPLLKAYQSALDLDTASGAVKQQARLRLESVLAQMPNSPFVRFHLGRAYLGAGEIAKATEQLERCVMLDPNYAPGWIALAETDLAAGRTALAQKRARALLTSNPGYRPAVLLDARTSLAANQAEAANQALTRLLESDPENLEALITQGEARARLRNFAAARQSLERAAALSPLDTRIVLLLAQIDWAENKRTAALDRLADARFAQQLPVRSAYAAFALQAGRFDLSLAEYQRLSRLEPKDTNHVLGIANSLGLLNRPEEAQKFYVMAQQATPDDARPWLLAASLLNQAGRVKESRFAYEQALARDKNNPYALNNLAYLLARSNQDLESALSYAEQARRSLPKSREIHDTLAYVYSALGMKRNLVATLRELAELQPPGDRIRTERILRQAERGEIATVRAELEKGRSL
ncbi:MAG: tetratricopeptide repeat protein, partial [Bryobacteraceae bacterium]|nr:tetratricopeptide repeat protein [Bryobacteraceae bacterium]